MQSSSNEPRIAFAVALGGWSDAPNQMVADMEGIMGEKTFRDLDVISTTVVQRTEPVGQLAFVD